MLPDWLLKVMLKKGLLLAAVTDTSTTSAIRQLNQLVIQSSNLLL